MTVSNQTGVIGFANDRSTTVPEFTTGQVVVASNTSYTYVQAASAQALSGVTALSGAYGATTTTAGSTYTNEVTGGVPSASYFWAKKVTSPF